MQIQIPRSFVSDNLFIWLWHSHAFFLKPHWNPRALDKTGDQILKGWKATIIVSEQEPISKSHSSHAGFHMFPSISSSSPMLQSWYVFTRSHISSTVIKTTMKLRNSSFAERSMVMPQAGQRSGEGQRRAWRNGEPTGELCLLLNKVWLLLERVSLT